jgi:hypothetical protein
MSAAARRDRPDTETSAAARMDRPETETSAAARRDRPETQTSAAAEGTGRSVNVGAGAMRSQVDADLLS